MSEQLAAAAPTRRRNRSWLWIFAVMGGLALLAIGINWAWNSMQPLTPERLQAARALWKEKGPADYDLKIARTIMTESADGVRQTIVDKYTVQVRGGKIVEFLVNGKQPEPRLNRDDTPNPDADREGRSHFSVDGIFDDIEEIMAKDTKDNLKSFLRARFNKEDGHLMLFSRQVNGLRNPYIQVDFKPVSGS